MLDRACLETVYQYILAVAGRLGRQLGPIHFLKYAYLADLAHAERRDGITFSGTDWRFYNFGPWSSAAFEEIAPALEAASAERFSYASQYGDEDWVRFGLEPSIADALAKRYEKTLPLVISATISNAVAEHGSDTADLLRHIYLTKPMLAARPGDILDFMTAVRPPNEPNREPAAPFSSAERKRRAAILESARAEVRKRLSAASRSRIAPSPAPRYDAVFYEGTAELDRLAGTPAAPSSGRIEFDESVWDSSFRRDPEIP